MLFQILFNRVVGTSKTVPDSDLETGGGAGGGGGSSRPLDKEDFWAPWTSVWSNYKGGTGPPGPSPGSATRK